MTSIRKSIAAAALGLALAGALGFGASELYANVANDSKQDCPSVCPLEEKASANSCPMEKAACPDAAKTACPDAKGA